jgi:hypothetical protein
MHLSSKVMMMMMMMMMMMIIIIIIIIIALRTTSIALKFMTVSLVLKNNSTTDTVQHTTKEGKICF